jgi:hypothetical protein
MITIYIALIAGGILAVVTIALQIAIFILIQNIDSTGLISKIKKSVWNWLDVFVNPAARVGNKKAKKF